MTTTFTRGVRENVPLLIGLAGGTGSGKTWSGMELATGLSGGKPFAVIDTENGRALHYADRFTFDHTHLKAPFKPAAYADAIESADKAGYPVIIVDSMSHEWNGDGGILDWQEEELKRLGGGPNVQMLSWAEPKKGHRKMMTRLLQVKAHVILCFRAEPKIDMVKGANGRTEVVPKVGPGGFKGWLPICDKNLPYELTASFLFMAEKPGEPDWIKVPKQLEPFFPKGRQVGAEAGRQLAEWARGGTQQGVEQPVTRSAGAPPAEPAPPPPADASPPNRFDSFWREVRGLGFKREDVMKETDGVEVDTFDDDQLAEIVERLRDRKGQGALV